MGEPTRVQSPKEKFAVLDKPQACTGLGVIACLSKLPRVTLHEARGWRVHGKGGAGVHEGYMAWDCMAGGGIRGAWGVGLYAMGVA